MAREVKKVEEKQQAVAQIEMNFFEQYGNQVAQKAIVGQLLKFSKGDYLLGQDSEEVEVGTKLVACMDQLMVGWVKWADNKPEQQVMGLLVEGYKPPPRNELGDQDESQWEVGSDGKVRDPWQFTNYLIMKDAGKKATDNEDLYTFTTSSKGGLGAIGSLCKWYGKEMRSHPDDNPVVELAVDSYVHPNKEFGKIKVPVLKPVGWESKKNFPAVKIAA